MQRILDWKQKIGGGGGERLDKLCEKNFQRWGGGQKFVILNDPPKGGQLPSRDDFITGKRVELFKGQADLLLMTHSFNFLLLNFNNLEYTRIYLN